MRQLLEPLPGLPPTTRLLSAWDLGLQFGDRASARLRIGAWMRLGILIDSALLLVLLIITAVLGQVSAVFELLGRSGCDRGFGVHLLSRWARRANLTGMQGL